MSKGTKPSRRFVEKNTCNGVKREFISHERWYELLSDEDGVLYLDVVCGGAFMYSVVIRMTDEQVAQYKAEGVSYLDDVAYRVTKGEFKDQIAEK